MNQKAEIRKHEKGIMNQDTRDMKQKSERRIQEAGGMR